MNKNILNYVNNKVINRYAIDFNKDPEFAKNLFTDFLRWFYTFGILESEGLSVPMTRSIIEIDHMWHTFILFTKDYQEFCHTYFGKFIHHAPTDEDSEIVPEDQRRKALKRYLEILAKEFGEELVFKWYKDNIYT